MLPLASSEHFRGIAPHYARVRTLDVRAVRRITRALVRIAPERGRLRLLDVGTGTGRYLRAVSAALRARDVPLARPVGVDASSAMVRGITTGGEWPADDAAAVVALAEALPLASGVCDAVLSFNAVHHLELDPFLLEAARLLDGGGLLVIYTRTPEQNRATIWGQHFPGFADREVRLPTHAALRAGLWRNGAFTSVRVRAAAWWQFSSLLTLVRQARARHYSTLQFYEPAEFEQALATFCERVRRRYRYPWAIPVRNNHTIVFARRRA